MTNPAHVDQIKQLAATALELRQGQRLEPSRLRGIADLAEKPADAQAFGFHVAGRAQLQLQKGSLVEQAKFSQAVAHSLVAIKRQVNTPRASNEEELRRCYTELAALQSEQTSAGVRVIESPRALVVEIALRTLRFPDKARDLAAQAAQVYCCRVDSLGSALVAESAPLLEDVADWWSRRLLGELLRDVVAVRPIRKPHAKIPRRPKVPPPGEAPAPAPATPDLVASKDGP
jgi:hypothetical protein